ncbi:hypothetical protein DFJ74DRAFT_758458 [Hyaloraphidium curvatum]|nr:hypothetical protein DFJ74DRAFT_758458 [Hyaloraphidium curvatum]
MFPTNHADRVAAGPFLSAAAWLCLLPGATRPSAAPTGAPPGFAESDPAKEAREASSLTRDGLARAFAGSPVHRALLAVEWNNPGINGNVIARFLLYSAPRFALFACTLWPVAMDSGDFNTRGIVTGLTVFLALELPSAFLARMTTNAAHALLKFPDQHAFACYARWRQLCGSEGQLRLPGGDATELGLGGGTDPLVRHDPGDDACTCPAESCSGSLVRRSAWLQATSVFLHASSGLFIWAPLQFWTAMVYFGSITWNSPWRALLAAWVLAYHTFSICSIAMDALSSDPALLALQARLRSRAVSLALSDLLRRCYLSLDDAQNIPWPKEEPYVPLHSSLLPAWRTLGHNVATSSSVSAAMVGMVVLVGCVSMVAAGCLPGYVLGTLAISVFFFLRVVVTVVSANAGVSRIAELYSRARTQLSLCAAREPDHHDAPRWRAHAEVLARFDAAARADLARMFGFVVDWGVVRGLVATGLTLGVGLFGILRGAGVGVTIQSVCPA